MRGKRILIGRNKINIRFADINDKEQLVNLRILQQHDDWGTDYFDYDGQFYNKTLDSLDNFLNCKNNISPLKGVILIAEKEEKIIATCGLQIINMLPQCNDDGKYGFIFNVFTLKEFRNQGIQSILMKKIIDYARQIGISEISLETDNEIAIKLYKKYNFKENKLAMTLQV